MMRPNMMRQAMTRLGLLTTALTVGCSGAKEPELGYCDVEPIIDEYCSRCHGDPVQHFAPFPLTTWESIHQVHSEQTGEFVWERMEDVVQRDVMPLVGLDLDPPVQPLPPEEKEILLEWLGRSAPQGSACD